MSIEVRFKLMLSWFDANVKWINLKEEKSLNILSKDSVDLLWMPQISFENADGICNLMIDESALVSINKRSDGQLLQYSNEVDIQEYFLSSQNPIEYERRYHQILHCDFQFFWYPFDQQICGIRLKLFDSIAKDVTLIPTIINYTGDQDLLQFNVINWNLVRLDDGAVEGQLTFQRNYVNHFATTFLPSFCILLISLCTLYFKPEHFKTSVPVTITSMLGKYYLECLVNLIFCFSTFYTICKNCTIIATNIIPKDD